MTQLTHLDESGTARMVDVGEKPVSARRAVASAFVHMRPETLELLQAHDNPKGDVIACARIAGIQAAKRCSELIPLCHSLQLDSVRVDFEVAGDGRGLRIRGECLVHGRTGVEMEAMTAVSVAALTVYDMCKAVDRGMHIEQLQLEEKSGGRSGDWRRAGAR